MRVTVVGLLLGLLLLGGCASSVDVEANEGVLRGPMLARVGTAGVTIAWQTRRKRTGAVRYGPTAACKNSARTPGAARRQAVALTGLKPATRYHYYVELDGARSTEVYSFVTAPAGKARFRFAFLGDSGLGSRAQRMVGQAILAARPDLVIHGGDLVYGKGADEDYDRHFFVPYRSLIATVPLYPCLGNHDYGTLRGQPYLDNLVLPDNNPRAHERFYSFVYGDAGFLCLDSNQFGVDFTLGGQRKWLQSQLANRSWNGWTFAFFHHPLYSAKKGRIAGALARRKKLAPILENGKVDVVLAGHDHYYHRTHPVSLTRKWTLVEIISGGGGASLYRGEPQRYTGKFKSAHHYVLVEVESAATLRVEARQVDVKTGKQTIIETVKLTRTNNGTRVW